MPVVMRKTDPKKGPKDTADSAATESRLPREIPPAVFIAAIAVVVLIVAFIAFRMFGPGETWDSTKEGTPPSASSLAAPPPLKRDVGDAPGGAGADQGPVGAELPPDVR